MIIIEKIEINGFRSISKATINCKDMNVFAGENDTGKSNILKALNLFFNGETDFLIPFNFANDYSKFATKSKRKKNVDIKLTLKTNLDSFKDKTVIWQKKFDKEGITDDRFILGDRGKLENLKGTGNAAPLARALNRFSYYYIPALKGKEVMAYVLSKMGEVETGGLISEENLSQLNKDISQNTSDSLKTLAEKSHFYIETTMALPSSLKELWEKLQVNSKLDGTKQIIPITQRGDGIKSIYLPILLEWIQEQKEKNSTAKRAFFWGIDEPENSLEYRKAEEVAQNYWSLYCKPRQIFITTHSSSFILPPDEHKDKCQIFSCSQDKEKKTILKNIGESLFIENTRDNLLEHLGLTLPIDQVKQLRELKEQNEYLKKIAGQIARPTVIVEGVSDKIILMAAWENLENDNPMPFDITPAGNKETGGGSKYISSFLNHDFLKEKDLKLIGLWDGDSTGIKSCKNFNSKNKNKNIIGMTLPCPPHRHEENDCNYCGTAPEHNHLIIEHYFEDNVLTDKLDIGGAQEKGVIEIKNYTTGKLDKNITKLSKDDFKRFHILFEEINKNFQEIDDQSNKK